MKKINHLTIILPLLFIMACGGNDKITNDTNMLPASSRQFISDYFKDIPVSHIQIEKNLIWISSYDVILTDGTNVEFNRKGEWKEIKRHSHPIPQAIIPEVIQNHIKKNYPSNRVVVMDKDIRDYEIKLDNGLEVKFDLKGNLIDIDY
ncbi:PepSY-like domain-containing protein [uncultured Parabacteroides sp.]|uniref:PepSY-like domain-containing protein n=1 Tax=uncultured Parabacteroides sp. TaxID=512312 RepID=UPI00262DFE66|nr:PepSY-like domain-containing protein [uncultured Parabacteroides sp.]